MYSFLQVDHFIDYLPIGFNSELELGKNKTLRLASSISSRTAFVLWYVALSMIMIVFFGS